jgi:septal ring factor EnvC (AmiA/AmiB activator)
MCRFFCIKFILILILVGCAGLYQDYETYWDANRHMNAAIRMENSKKLYEAMLEYVYVAENYPASSFYKTAIFKIAILSGHPDNPKRNLSTSLFWLVRYLNLPLSEQEQQTAQLLTNLIKENKQYQDSIAQLQKAVQNQKSIISQNDLEITAFKKQIQKKITLYEQELKARNRKIRQLQVEISKAQDALQELKKIDMRIHERKLEKR